MAAVRRGFAMKRLCVRFTMTGKLIISAELAGEWSERDPKMVRDRDLEIPGNNTSGVEDDNESAQEEEQECAQLLLRKHLLST